MVDDSTSPAFRSLETNETYEAPKVSKLGIAAVFLGVVGLVAILAPGAFLICIAAVVAGLGAAVLGLKADDGGSGLKLGTVASALGVFGAAWSGTSLGIKNDYLYQEAGKNAKVFMDIVASGNIYLALELTLPEPDRQITGTDLEKYYFSLEGEAKDIALSFFDTPAGRRVTSTTDADWQFVQGYTVRRERSAQLITVIMKNMNEPDSEPVFIRMQRAEGVVVADPDEVLWNVDGILSAEEATLE